VVHSGGPEHLLSFDTGPGNNLLDRYIFSRTQGSLYFDQDGALSLKGSCHALTLKKLIAAHQDYLLAPPPKSLDIADLKLVRELDDLTLEDACCTLATFTSNCIAEGLTQFSPDIPHLWILAGGGAHHPTIVSVLKQHAAKHGAQLFLAHEMGWDNGGLEAELIAYAAVRHHRNLPLTYPNTTGVQSPQVGGRSCLPLAADCTLV
jgi:anhydro-N-acetylmuramic acid kinase